MSPAPVPDASTAKEKALACLSGFGFACLAFVVAAVLLVPLTGAVGAWLGLPGLLVAAVVVLELFALPPVAAVFGVGLAAPARRAS